MTGALVDDAIAWTVRREPTWDSTSYHARLHKHRAHVWKKSSMALPWRGVVHEEGRERDMSRMRSYATAEAALSATGERLRKAAER